MKPTGNRIARRIGIGSCLLSAVAGYFAIYLPIAQAVSGAPNVSYHAEAVNLVVDGMMVGLNLLIDIDHLDRSTNPPMLQMKRFGLTCIMGVIVLVIVSLGSQFGVQYLMNRLGYPWFGII